MMPDPTKRVRPVAGKLQAYFDLIADHAEKAGLPREVAESLIGIDASVFAWRRRTLKGEMSRRILAELDTDIEQAEFEALTAVARLSVGIGGKPPSEVTIGDVAEEMDIDPSRASRLVTALVQKGYLRREIAQSDARRSIVMPTEASDALFENFMVLKWRIVLAAFKDWSQSDVQAFERLLSRYVGAMDDAMAGAGSAQTPPAPGDLRHSVTPDKGRTESRGR